MPPAFLLTLQVLSAATLDHAIVLQPAGLDSSSDGARFFSQILGLKPLRHSIVERVAPASPDESWSDVSAALSLRFCAAACVLQRFSSCMPSEARGHLASVVRSMRLTCAEGFRA